MPFLMVVFSHKCLPLTVNLREPTGNHEEIEGDWMRDEFRLILQALSSAVTFGKVPEDEIAFDYSYSNLYRPLKVGGKKRVLFERVSHESARRLLKERTHWYKRLPKQHRHYCDVLIWDSRGRRELKEYLHTVDGMLISLIFSVPEMFLAAEDLYGFCDQIINSILTRCLAGGYTTVLKDFKRIRKEVKWHSMTGNERPVNYDFMRSYSWMVPFLKTHNELRFRTSKSKMMRVAMFCQTRATGLASEDLCKESIKDFLETVAVPGSFEPNQELLDSIDFVTTELASKLNYGTHPNFKISASTSACFETNRRKGGKFEQLRKEMIKEGLRAPDHLIDSCGGQIGSFMFQKALEKAIWKDEDLLKVNVAAVRENGKARVITSGSFWKDTLLQGFSHLTIEIIKNIRDLEDSLQAARHGWKFISRLDYLDAEQGWPLFEEAFLFSFDWTKATDNPTHASGRAVMRPLFDKLQIPDYITDAVLDVWLGMKDLYIKGEHVGKLLRGIPMGDPLTKTNLSLAHPICKRYATLKSSSKSLGAGNGDDGVQITQKSEFALYFREAAAMLGYKESEMDTMVTNHWGTYCEEYFYLPQDRFNTVKVGNRTNNNCALPYLDYPKLRLVIDTRKDREDYSSDITGKVTLLGKDMEYVEKSEGPESTIFSIAAAFQDVSLGIIQDDKPLYMPRQVNGVGRPPPHWNNDAWFNIILNAKEWHRRYYLFAMRDYVSGNHLVTGRKGILKESIHFDGELRVETLEIPSDDPIKKYEELSVENQKKFHPGVLDKLESLGYLTRESKVSKYYLFNERLKLLNGHISTESDLFEKIKTDVIDLDYSQDHKVWKRIISRFTSLYRSEPYALKAQRPEPLYPGWIIDVLKTGDPLRVDIDLEVFKKFSGRVKPDTPYKRAVATLHEWYVSNRDPILAGLRCKPPPTDVLADDPIIIQTLSEMEDLSTFYFIVTNDVKLYRLACAKLPSMKIGRIPIRVWFACGLNEESFHNEYHTQFPNGSMEILIDQGSIESYIMTHDISYSSMGRWMLNDRNFNLGYRGIPWSKDISKTKKVHAQPYISEEMRTVATPSEAKFPWFGYTNPGLLRNEREPDSCYIHDFDRSLSMTEEAHVRRA